MDDQAIRHHVIKAHGRWGVFLMSVGPNVSHFEYVTSHAELSTIVIAGGKHREEPAQAAKSQSGIALWANWFRSQGAHPSLSRRDGRNRE
jgi:hypothetical protein